MDYLKKVIKWIFIIAGVLLLGMFVLLFKLIFKPSKSVAEMLREIFRF